MAIRVDREGFGQPLDPVAVSGGSAGGTPVYDDGARPEPWQDRPWADRNEIMASQTLQLMSIPGEQLAQIRPPVPYVLFPEQELGFVPQPLTIEDVLNTDRWSPRQRSWLSPTIQPPNKRSDLGDTAWAGTARGASGNPQSA